MRFEVLLELPIRPFVFQIKLTREKIPFHPNPDANQRDGDHQNRRHLPENLQKRHAHPPSQQANMAVLEAYVYDIAFLEQWLHASSLRDSVGRGGTLLSIRDHGLLFSRPAALVLYPLLDHLPQHCGVGEIMRVWLFDPNFCSVNVSRPSAGWNR